VLAIPYKVHPGSPRSCRSSWALLSSRRGTRIHELQRGLPRCWKGPERATGRHRGRALRTADKTVEDFQRYWHAKAPAWASRSAVRKQEKLGLRCLNDGIGGHGPTFSLAKILALSINNWVQNWPFQDEETILDDKRG